MKTLFSFLFLIFIFNLLFSQEQIEVNIVEKEMSQGLNTAFVVLVPEASQDFVETRWKKYANNRPFFENVTKGAAGRLLGNTYKSVANKVSPEKAREKNREKLRVEKVEDEFVVSNIVHEHVTQNLLDIYARIIKLEKGTQLSAFFRFSDSIFVSDTNVDNETIISFKNYIYEFGVETYRGVVENQIKDAEKELRKMNVVLSNMESKNESLNKSITKAESEIHKCESSIELNTEQSVRVKEKINEVKKQMLGHKKKSLAYEGYKNLLDEREKENKKIHRNTKSLKSKIKRQEIKIKNALSDIVENEMDQKGQQEVIENQELLVEELELKLSRIK